MVCVCVADSRECMYKHADPLVCVWQTHSSVLTCKLSWMYVCLYGVCVTDSCECRPTSVCVPACMLCAFFVWCVFGRPTRVYIRGVCILSFKVYVWLYGVCVCCSIMCVYLVCGCKSVFGLYCNFIVVPPSHRHGHPLALLVLLRLYLWHVRPITGPRRS